MVVMMHDAGVLLAVELALAFCVSYWCNYAVVGPLK